VRLLSHSSPAPGSRSTPRNLLGASSLTPVLAIVTAAAVLGGGVVPVRGGATKFNEKTAPFSIAFNGETSAYEEMSTFVMPNARLTVEITGAPAGASYMLKTEEGASVAQAGRGWRWTAPAVPGQYDLKVSRSKPAEKDKHDITLHVFVMTPAADIRDGYLNGYRIGSYPAKPLNGNPIYLPPAGFVEVTKKNRHNKITPHFTLEQFLCKEDLSDRYPKYVLIKERLLLKLEAVLAHVNNDLGIKTDTLHVMSAFRTPYYNKAIGDVLYSQHQWGSAADIFIDPHHKNRMADLDGNRVVDIRDAKFFYDRIEDMLALRPFQRFQGGMGYYPATSAHPPFVHVDVRGTKARWKG
jgi:Peptidase M15